MNNSTWRFIKRGFPFFSIVGGGVFALFFFQRVRYDFRRQSYQTSDFKNIKKELSEAGIMVKENVTVEDLYEEILNINVDNWDNVRGPRPHEDNTEYMTAKKKQQNEAKEKRRKLKTERSNQKET